MKREIKFRAWDKRHNQFCTDFAIVQFPDGSFYIDYVRGNKFEHHVDNNENVDLMQFTGLKDKNDKEIYEGDVVVSETYDDWGPREVEMEYQNWEPFQYWMDSESWEVIGNIYENPELLKQ